MNPSLSEQALTALQVGQAAQACALFDQCIEQEERPHILLQAAFCYRSEGHLDKALSILRLLDERGQNSPPALLLRADIFCSADRQHHALPLYRQLADMDDPKISYPVALGLFNCGQIAAAQRLAEKLSRGEDASIAGYAKLLLGRCFAASEQFEEAETIFDSVEGSEAIERSARFRQARLALHRGDFGAAEKQFRELIEGQSDATGARESLLQTLIHSGQTDAARADIEANAAQCQDLPWLQHATDLLVELGDPEALRLLESAWSRDHRPATFREYLSRLLVSREFSEAKSLLDEYAASVGQDPHWRWGASRYLSDSGEHEALLSFAGEGTLQRDMLESVCVSHFALGNYARALELAQSLCREAPGDQHFLAMLVTALRCLDDPRYQSLIDTDNMVGVLSLEAEGELPQGLSPDWTLIAGILADKHSMKQAPQLQSVREGLQTPGNLFSQSQNSALGSLKRLINDRAQSFFNREWLKQLPEAHPLRMFRPKQVSMHASWAIRGRMGTFHQSHVHAKGWYSGTCYVEVPPSVSAQSDAGYLVFGEPPFPIKDPLGPIATIQPKAGQLVLFPSYFGHGTRPYSGDGLRQVIAFDFGEPNRFV